MSHENVEIVRAIYAAFNRGDVDAALTYLAPGFELDWSRSMGTRRGLYQADQIRRFINEFAEMFESVQVEPNEFIDAGERLIVPHDAYVRGREGIEVTAQAVLVWTVKAGKIVRCCLYQDRREALEAVGLSAQDAHPEPS